MKNIIHKDLSDTYGEILPVSVAKLLSIIKLTQDDVFFDLGSGLGQVVLQVFLQSSVRSAVGIELQSHLHEQAMIAAQVLPYSEHQNRSLKFIRGDFLLEDLADATVVFICSACFTLSQLKALARKLDGLPHLHTVLTLKPILNFKRFAFEKTIRVECSWDTALCYVYRASKL